MKVLVLTGLPVDESNEKILNIIKRRSPDAVFKLEREPGAATGKLYYKPAVNAVRSLTILAPVFLVDCGIGVDFSLFY
ncbi:hypothetical protein [Pseudomonas glycinae]|uniref:hypothetical protein n=1 Tax=Pseudomonas glycinae TaxID=1785145 RepID=UPI001F1B3A1C|nr:hypothetical protein [Pseudomonas glycinae]